MEPPGDPLERWIRNWRSGTPPDQLSELVVREILTFLQECDITWEIWKKYHEFPPSAKNFLMSAPPTIKADLTALLQAPIDTPGGNSPNVDQWTVTNVVQWLEAWYTASFPKKLMELPEIQEKFRSFDITGVRLRCLRDDDLHELGLRTVGQQSKFYEERLRLPLPEHSAGVKDPQDLEVAAIDLNPDAKKPLQLQPRMENLRTLADTASDKFFSPCISFVGPTGVGKSHLLTEFLPLSTRLAQTGPSLAVANQQASTTGNIHIYHGQLRVPSNVEHVVVDQATATKATLEFREPLSLTERSAFLDQLQRQLGVNAVSLDEQPLGVPEPMETSKRQLRLIFANAELLRRFSEDVSAKRLQVARSLLLMDIEGEEGGIPLQMKETQKVIISAWKLSLENGQTLELEGRIIRHTTEAADKRALKACLQLQMNRRRSLVNSIFPQIAYLTSNIIIFVNTLELHNALYYARLKSFTTVADSNLRDPDKPHLIVVQNKVSGLTDDHDPEECTRKFIENFRNYLGDDKDMIRKYASIWCTKLPDANVCPAAYRTNLKQIKDRIAGMLEEQTGAEVPVPGSPGVRHQGLIHYTVEKNRFFTQKSWYGVLSETLRQFQDATAKDTLNTLRINFRSLLETIYQPPSSLGTTIYRYFLFLWNPRREAILQARTRHNNHTAVAELRSAFFQCRREVMHKFVALAIWNLEKRGHPVNKQTFEEMDAKDKLLIIFTSTFLCEVNRFEPCTFFTTNGWYCTSTCADHARHPLEHTMESQGILQLFAGGHRASMSTECADLPTFTETAVGVEFRVSKSSPQSHEAAQLRAEFVAVARNHAVRVLQQSKARPRPDSLQGIGSTDSILALQYENSVQSLRHPAAPQTVDESLRDNCLICLRTFDPQLRRRVLVICGHAYFCAACVRVCDRKRCPICERPLVAAEPPKMPGLAKPRILCLDGGGVRGIIEWIMLQRILAISPLKAHELFDLIGGTSAGSILTAFLATRRASGQNAISDEQLPQHMRALAQNVFQKPFGLDAVGNAVWNHTIGKLTGRHPYELPRLELELKSLLPKKSILEFTAPEFPRFIIFANAPHDKNNAVGFANFLCSTESTKVSRLEQSPTLIDAVAASSAAPTYFRPKILGSTQYVDGGVIVNNPSSQTLQLLRQGIFSNVTEPCLFISLGTCNSYGAPVGTSPLSWGKRAAEYMTDTESPHKELQTASDNGRQFAYYRFNDPQPSISVGLDDPSSKAFQDMEAIAAAYITSQSTLFDEAGFSLIASEFYPSITSSELGVESSIKAGTSVMLCGKTLTVSVRTRLSPQKIFAFQEANGFSCISWRSRDSAGAHYTMSLDCSWSANALPGKRPRITRPKTKDEAGHLCDLSFQIETPGAHRIQIAFGSASSSTRFPISGSPITFTVAVAPTQPLA